jgi:hypothetical protein
LAVTVLVVDVSAVAASVVAVLVVAVLVVAASVMVAACCATAGRFKTQSKKIIAAQYRDECSGERGRRWIFTGINMLFSRC